ncbi:hypothetical protein [Maricaulis sp.]|uniref:hypothetical protein n=1 Tax=unclassified Maricaulis TaxID=2632371 RepID=UPI001B2E1C2C|nr:hypothetical protein [Maricaulis sp.]MBO6798269.1 hypothetical protein [Maricaulis sp.]
MADDIETVRDDLAFMRALADAPDKPNKAMGQSFLAAGIIYGFQGLVQWATAIGIIGLSGLGYLAFVIGCTVAFFAVLGVIIWKNRGQSSNTAVRRAYEAAFQGAGVANICLVIVFIVANIRTGDGGVWYFYTPFIYALQGVAWYLAFRMRKRAWLGLVALGWYVGAIALGLTAHSPTYVLVIALSLILLLAGPGLVMMRVADKQSETAD